MQIKGPPRPLLVRPARGPLMIVDAGAGDKMDEKSTAIYAFDRREHLDVTMARAGVAAADIEIVLASHLHFDHAGGFTALDESGAVVAEFEGIHAQVVDMSGRAADENLLFGMEWTARPRVSDEAGIRDAGFLPRPSTLAAPLQDVATQL